MPTIFLEMCPLVTIWYFWESLGLFLIFYSIFSDNNLPVMWKDHSKHSARCHANACKRCAPWCAGITPPWTAWGENDSIKKKSLLNVPCFQYYRFLFSESRRKHFKGCGARRQSLLLLSTVHEQFKSKVGQVAERIAKSPLAHDHLINILVSC